MSLLPYLLEDSHNLLGYPRRGNWLSPLEEDIYRPLVVAGAFRDLNNYMKQMNAALGETAGSVSYDKDKFQANFDVQHFKPEEISVKISEDKKSVTIEGKHEEKQDEHGQIYRHFVRKYTLPDNCDIERLESKLSSDGVLSISAPRIGDRITSEVNIPITQTGQPAKSIQDNDTKKN